MIPSLGGLLPVAAVGEISGLACQLPAKAIHGICLDPDQCVKRGGVLATQVAASARVAEPAPVSATDIRMCRVLGPEPGAIHVFVDVDDLAGLVLPEMEVHGAAARITCARIASGR